MSDSIRFGLDCSPIYTDTDYANDWPTCYGSGPVPADVMLVGEAPAWTEIREKIPFAGPSGDVLWPLLRRGAGLSRSDVYVTNVLKHCVEGTARKKGKDKISDDEIDYWRPLLEKEFRLVQPKWVITLGAWAARTVLGLDVTMDECWGLPYAASHHYTVIPVHHPANGLHRPDELRWTLWGLEAAGQIMRGQGPRMPQDAHPRPLYRERAVGMYDPKAIAIDTEGYADDPWSLQWSIEPGTGSIIWARDKMGLQQFQAWLLRARPLVVFHNATHDLKVLRAMGIDIIGMGLRIADTMTMAANRCDLPLGLKPLAWRLAGMRMASFAQTTGKFDQAVVDRYLQRVVDTPELQVRPAPRKHSIAQLAKARLGKEDARESWGELEPERRQPAEALYGPMPRMTLADVDEAELLRYACADPDATLRCYRALVPSLVERELIQVATMDLRTLPYVDAMEANGLPCDVAKLEALRAEMHQKEADLRQLCKTLAEDDDFNPGSGAQISEWCRQQWIKHKRCGLDRMTRSKTHEATDEESLQTIAGDHPLIPVILEWKQVNKLNTAYLDKLPGLLRNGIYYPDFNTTTVVSGRSAEWILTFPAQTEQGRRIRDCFVAPKGWKFGGADLSQIELRLAAELSQDPVMLEAFKSGADLHTRTAARYFNKPDHLVDKMRERHPCKTLNFRVLYMGGAFGLSRQLTAMGLAEWTPEKCEQLIDGWFKVYAAIRPAMRAAGDEGRMHGFVRDRYGRRRYLPALYLDDDKLRTEAERQAFNFKIQTWARGLLKRAQIRLWESGMAQNSAVRPVLEYHDELVFLVRPDHEEVMRSVTLNAMTADQPSLDVPIAAEWASGPTWGSLKE